VTLRIGTRRSKLALEQAQEVATELAARGVDSELVPMTTSGDRGGDPYSDPAGVKGLFVTEIERALRVGEIDLAVHSAKDLPAHDDDDLAIAAVPERLSPLDVLVTRDGELAAGSRVGTSSVRRRSQVFRWRPDVLVKDVRGNVDTRLRKLADGEVDALILAAAGLLRLRVVPEHAQPMSIWEIVPAPGQGCLAVQARTGDETTISAIAPLDHAPSRDALAAERTMMRALGGGCALPLGAFAERRDHAMWMVAVVLTPDGGRYARAEAAATTPEEVAELVRLDLAASGADEILSHVRP
jgi:hydroxymethylbilane synthase